MSQNLKIAQPEVIYCETDKASCDGGVGVLGHPRVYLKMDSSGQATCTYCDKQFIKTGSDSDKR